MMQNPNHNNYTPMSSFINTDDEAEKEKHGFGGKVESSNNNGDNDNTNGDISNNAVVGGGTVGCSTPLRSNVVRQQQIAHDTSLLRPTEILSPLHTQKPQPTLTVIQTVQQQGIPTIQKQQASHPTTALPNNTLSSSQSQPQQPPPTVPPPTKNVTRKGRFNIVIQTTGSSPPRSHSRQKVPAENTTTTTTAHAKIPTSPQVPVTKGKFTVSAVTMTPATAAVSTNDDAKSSGDTASVGTIGEMSVNSVPPLSNGIVKGKFTVSAATTTVPTTGATMPTPHITAGEEPQQQSSLQQPSLVVTDNTTSSTNITTHPVANDGSITKGKFTVRAVSSTSHGSINSQLTTNSQTNPTTATTTHSDKSPTEPIPTDAIPTIPTPTPAPPPPGVVKGKFTISAVNPPLPPTEPPAPPTINNISPPPPPIPESLPPHDVIVQPTPLSSLHRTPSRETLTTKKKGRFVLIQAELPSEQSQPPTMPSGVSAAVAILPTNETLIAENRPAVNPPVMIAQTVTSTTTTTMVNAEGEGEKEECGLGGLVRCWEMMGREVREADKVVKGLKEAMRLLHDKNRELEQRNHELEKKYTEEKRHRQSIEKKLKILTKTCRERDAAAAAAATTMATAAQTLMSGCSSSANKPAETAAAVTVVASSNNASHVNGINSGTNPKASKTLEPNRPRHVRHHSDLGTIPTATAAVPTMTTSAAQTQMSGCSSSSHKLSDSDSSHNYYHGTTPGENDNMTPLTAASTTKHETTTPLTTTSNEDIAAAAPKQTSEGQLHPFPQLPFSAASSADHLPLHEEVPHNLTSGTNGLLTDSPPAQHQQHQHHHAQPKQQQPNTTNTTPPTNHKNSESNSSLVTIATPCNSCTSSTASHSSSPSTAPPTHPNPTTISSSRIPTRVQRSQSFTTSNSTKTTPPPPCNIPSSSSYTCPSSTTTTSATTMTHTYFDPLQSHSGDSRTYSSDSDDSPPNTDTTSNDLLTLISYPVVPQQQPPPAAVVPATLVMTNDWSTTTMPLPPGCLNQTTTTIMQGTWHQQPAAQHQPMAGSQGGVYGTIPRQFLMVPQQAQGFQQGQGPGVHMPYPQGGVNHSLGVQSQQQQPTTASMDPFIEIVNRPGAKW